MNLLFIFLQIAVAAWDLFSDTWYWLVIGIIGGTFARKLIPRKRIFSALGRGSLFQIAVASVFGIVDPLCACTVIPLLIGLFISGIPLALIIAYTITSPLIGPESFIMTAGILGIEMAFARLASTFFIGMGAGLFTLYLTAHGYLQNQIRIAQDIPCCKPDRPNSTGVCTHQSRSRLKDEMHNLLKDMWNLAYFVGKYFILTIILGGVIKVLISREQIILILGSENPLSVLLVTALAIPIYMSGAGSLPMLKVLIEMGMEPGAALAFLIAGPGTCIPMIGVIASMVKRKTFFLYFVSVVVGAVVSGYVYDLANHMI
jgi:hypothetical protein